MPYWDASAVIPIFVDEARSEQMTVLAGNDPDPSISWLTQIECMSTLARLVRECRMSADDAPGTRALLEDYLAAADEVAMTQALRELACRLLQRHALRTGDAIQLAGALVWAGGMPTGKAIDCLDKRLREAAAREGFTVLPEAI